MKPFIILTTLFIISCSTTKKSTQYILYDQFNKFKFQGQAKGNTYKFQIDTVMGGHFKGLFVINAKDSVKVEGFEKGRSKETAFYPLSYHTIGTSQTGGLFIFYQKNKGATSDQLIITHGLWDKPLFQDTLILYRVER